MQQSYFPLLIIVAIIRSSCSSIPPEKRCSIDSDCIPAACCHATDIVNKEYAPNCKDQLCTLDCQPNTLDCGQGQVKCIQKQCTTILSSLS